MFACLRPRYPPTCQRAVAACQVFLMACRMVLIDKVGSNSCLINWSLINRAAAVLLRSGSLENIRSALLCKWRFLVLISSSWLLAFGQTS